MIENLVHEIVSMTDMSQREAFGQALCLFGSNKQVVVIDADLSTSTKTCIFAKKYPSRFINVGIAEQDMVGVGAGLAACGKIPVIATFAVFLVGRALDQLRNMVAYSNLNVKLIGCHAGIATGEDGATHQALEDIGIMRGIPGITIFSPSDAIETIYCLKYMIETSGPFYLRLTRAIEPIFHNENYHFTPDRMEILKDYHGKQVAILATGPMVSRIIEAATILQAQNIDVGIINLHTIKPIDLVTIKSLANEVNLLITVEDHNIIGGIGTAVADALAEIKTSTILRKIGINDTFGESGSQTELYTKYELTPESIAKRVINELKAI